MPMGSKQMVASSLGVSNQSRSGNIMVIIGNLQFVGFYLIFSHRSNGNLNKVRKEVVHTFHQSMNARVFDQGNSW